MKRKRLPTLDVLIEWLKNKKYIEFREVQNAFNLSEKQLFDTLNYLASLGFVSPKPTKNRIKVLRNKDVMVRVTTSDLSNNQTIYLSEPMKIGEAVSLIKRIVPTLPSTKNNIYCVKFVEDHGPSYDYGSADGNFVFTHSNAQQFYDERIY